MTEHWVSADVPAEHLDVTKDSISTWIAKRHVPDHRVGCLWKSKVDGWVRNSGTEEMARHSKRPAR